MNTEKIIDEIYKVYPMCKAEIVTCDDAPSMICISVRLCYYGDCLGFAHYVNVGAQGESCEDVTTALANLVTSRIKEELDSYGGKINEKIIYH